MSVPLQDRETFNREVDEMLTLHRRLALSEPVCRYVGDPPGKALALEYAARSPRVETGENTRMPVFCAEIPLTPTHRSESYLVAALLVQLGDPDAHKREDMAQKASRFIKLLREYRVELAILTDMHRLVTPRGAKLLENEFDWIKWIFKSELQTVALLLVGEIEVLHELIDANAQFKRLLYPIELGEGAQEK